MEKFENFIEEAIATRLTRAFTSITTINIPTCNYTLTDINDVPFIGAIDGCNCHTRYSRVKRRL
jgi:hypothetical protein